MSFDYRRDTKDHYKSNGIAEQYHFSFTGAKGLRGLRFRWIADHERAAVRRLIKLVPHGTVLDIPAGTGKMAVVFNDLGSKVTSADVSEAMLAIAKEEYKRLGYVNVEFRICDAERIRETLDARFDVVVCIRLLHRAPPDVKRAILTQLAYTAKYSIVSFGINSPWHRVRRTLVRSLFGGEDIGQPMLEPMGNILSEIHENFEVISRASVLPFLSGEYVFLLRSHHA